MRRLVTVVFFYALGASVLAQESEEDTSFSLPEEQMPFLDRLKTPPPLPLTSLRLQLLDKISCQFLHTLVQVGRLYAFGRLRFIVTRAFKNPPEEYPEFYALLKIWEVVPPGNGGDQTTSSLEKKCLIFSGWMFASSPAIAPLEHPVYDVRVLIPRSSPS
jgi:hypothetical protein